MFKKIFISKNGKYIIFQKPNLPLKLALGFWLLGFLPLRIFQTVSEWGLTLSLLYWSYLETIMGDSAFRRIIGITVMIYSVLRLFKLFTDSPSRFI